MRILLQNAVSDVTRKASRAFAVAVLLSGLPAARADVVSAYVGGAVGQGRIDTGNQTTPTNPTFFPTPTSIGSFTENHSAYKLVAGVRAIALVGAEIEYLDLGHPSRSFSLPGGAIGSADVKMNGGGAFGVLYLPVPVVSVYLKGGLARLEATSNVTVAIPGLICQINIPSCTRFTKTYRTTNTSFAAGAGVQVKLGPIALRAEYERFNAAGGNPGLASLGAFWNFL